MPFSIVTFSIKGTQHSDTRHQLKLSLMLNGVFSYCYAERRYAECRYAECCYAECRGAESTPSEKKSSSTVDKVKLISSTHLMGQDHRAV